MMVLPAFILEKARTPVGIAAIAVFALGGATFFLWPGPTKTVEQDAEERLFVDVKRVISAQKVKLDHDQEEYLMYAGIRAPVGGEAMYDESVRRNTELVDQKKLRLRFDEEHRDAEGRLLAYVFVEDAFINESLVREGLAYARSTWTSKRFAQRLLAAQADARKQRRGIWAKRTPTIDASYVGDPKYGNFHRLPCEEAIKIPSVRRVDFKTDSEAFELCFAPCAKCKP